MTSTDKTKARFSKRTILGMTLAPLLLAGCGQEVSAANPWREAHRDELQQAATDKDCKTLIKLEADLEGNAFGEDADTKVWERAWGISDCGDTWAKLGDGNYHDWPKFLRGLEQAVKDNDCERWDELLELRRGFSSGVNGEVRLGFGERTYEGPAPLCRQTSTQR